MRTVGEILKKARAEKNLSLEDIEKKIKIRKKYLISLEENRWNALPPLPYIKGFIRNYSGLLGLNSEEMVAIFRRQYDLNEQKSLIPQGVRQPLNEPLVKITPQLTIAIISLAFVGIIFGYLLLQYKSFLEAPALIINEPKEGEIMYSETVNISGSTNPDAVVSVNNNKIVVGGKGEFFTHISLPPGIHTITIETVGKNGKTNTVTRNIQIQNN